MKEPFINHNFKIYKEKDILNHAKKINEAAQKYNSVCEGFPYEFRQACNIERLTR